MLRDSNITLATWREPRYLKWSYQHVREFIPTARIARAERPSPMVTSGDGEHLLALSVVADGEEATVGGVLEASFTDGFLILHNGRVALELYDGMDQSSTHLLQSVSKSITGVLTGILVCQGLLAPEDEVATHVPELADTSYAGATVRHLLDMRAGTRFDETYENPESDAAVSMIQFGWAPAPDGLPAPDSVAYIARMSNEREHGGRFEYRSILTDVLGLVLERAAGVPFAELLSQHLWGPLGAEYDADFTVDPQGFPLADGGICATLRDVGRFGRMVLDHGVVEGRIVVPSAWIADTLKGGSDSKQAFADSDGATDDHCFPGGHYRNQWWVPGDGSTLIGWGVHGQFLYVDWASATVGVKLSTYPPARDDHEKLMTIAAFRAIAHHLQSRGPA